ncbi:hypothetical protein OS493_015755 [Desmophyllum pertusum]|uniref:Uncharacterized protein n=1 Tax=Desmophyllum pertusum TaxID=174260 RepID=A0A9W9YPL1_9CNID|nr:hypothetical protein OS493_015755 [Desmophyllum pertusum]
MGKGHQWDFAHVKHLCGNGRLYVRLITSKEEMEQKDATLTTSSQLSQGSASTSFSRMPSHASASATVRLSDVPHSAPVSDVPPAVSDDDDLPEFGAAQSMPTTEQKVARLAAVFPVIPLPVIRNALLSLLFLTEAQKGLLMSPDHCRPPSCKATVLVSQSLSGASDQLGPNLLIANFSC